MKRTYNTRKFILSLSDHEIACISKAIGCDNLYIKVEAKTNQMTKDTLNFSEYKRFMIKLISEGEMQLDMKDQRKNPRVFKGVC